MVLLTMTYATATPPETVDKLAVYGFALLDCVFTGVVLETPVSVQTPMPHTSTAPDHVTAIVCTPEPLVTFAM